MVTETLAQALEREHHEIDERIEAFRSSREVGHSDLASLTTAIEALRRHIYLEEEFLFPPLRDAGMVGPVWVMLREHGEMWRTLDALEAELAGDSGSTTVVALCDELVPKLEAHNAKEETILYPQADNLLSEPARAELERFLETGHMPDGWVCERAGA